MTQQTSKGYHITLWILQVVLGALYIMAGAGKSFQPIEELAKQMPWVNSVSVELVRFIGASELLGGLGLILPALLRIKPILTPVAAIGLALVQVFAAVFHISRGEYAFIGINLVFVAIAIFIAWGRTKKAPIYARA
ncbi:MAG: DoxX family protein [Chitinophagaceae bacterium]|uniref:DoxX family protein n=1 Tax=unclassified Paraflavitalea TaxID=2798305 RepID=UPI003D3403A0|nr:DoxX family protein [Chitinophagaceae bacterium]